MMLKKQTLKMWRYVTTDEQVQWLLAPNLEHALWAAAESVSYTHLTLPTNREV